MSSPPSSLRSELPALLALVGLLVLFFPKMVAFQEFLFLGDVLQLYYPCTTYCLSQILDAGTWPLWTENLYMGYPIFAQGQGGTLFPTNLPYFFLPSVLAFNCVTLGNLLAAAVGMYVFLRAITRNTTTGESGPEMPAAAALTGAVVYAFSARLTLCIMYTGDMRVLSALPWCLWAVYRLIHSPTFGRTAICALAFSFLGLAGKPDLAFQVAIVLVVSAIVWHILSRKHTPRPPLPHTALFLFIASGLLAIFLSAIQWLPTLELLEQSARQKTTPYDRWIAGSLPPKQMLGFLVPWLFGNPLEGTYVGAWNPSDLEFYLGPVAIVLIVNGFFSGRKERWLWAGFFLAGLLLALGEHLPGYSLLYHVPLLKQSRIPGRWLHLALIGGALLAAYGSAALAEAGSQGSDSRNGLWSVWATAALLALAAFIAFGEAPHEFPQYTHGGTKVFFQEDAKRAAQLATQRRLHWAQSALMLSLAAGVMIAARRFPQWRRWAAPALVVLMALDQRAHLGDFHPTRPASAYRPESPVIDFLKKQSLGSRFYSQRSHVAAYYLARTRFRRGTEKEALGAFYRHVTPNSALVAGLYDAGGYGELGYAGRPEPDMSPDGLKTLAAWGVRFIVTRPDEVPPGKRILVQSEDAAVFEIPPRPYLVYQEEPVPGGGTQWTIVRRESYFPGWFAFVGGKKFPVRRVEGIFQEVEGPSHSGHPSVNRLPESPFSSIQFVYDPMSFKIGLALSLLALSLIFAIGMQSAMKRE